MIIGHDMMVQLNFIENLKFKVLAWDDEVVPMKHPGNFLGKPNLTKREMIWVVIHTSEPDLS